MRFSLKDRICADGTRGIPRKYFDSDGPEGTGFGPESQEGDAPEGVSLDGNDAAMAGLFGEGGVASGSSSPENTVATSAPTSTSEVTQIHG